MSQTSSRLGNTDAPVLALARELIRRESVTPEDAGCQRVIADRLAALGFEIEHMRIGEVDNLWATWGTGGPFVIFAGHTDVVPTGPLTEWQHPPFTAVVDDQLLHGRGSADMKTSLAAMVVAVEQLLGNNRLDASALRIGFLITSDEEGPAIDGTQAVVERLVARQTIPDYCIVGEPSSSARLGDVIRNGRRGSLNGKLIVKGTQGHVAYPELAANPIAAALPALTELTQIRWDEGNEYYPATSFQISNINAGTGATNVVPGTIEVLFNFRYCTEQTAEDLEAGVEKVLGQVELDYDLEWTRSGLPFLTPKGKLTDAVCAAVEQHMGHTPELSTSGGTSDGRFIATMGTQVIELGPQNATIHKIDEAIPLGDIEPLAAIYASTLENLADSK